VAAQTPYCSGCGEALVADAEGSGTPGVSVVLVPLDESIAAGESSARDAGASRWILRGVLALVICGLGVYYLLPGAFDSTATSVFASGERRSPLLAFTGPVELLNQPYEVSSGEVGRVDFTIDVPATVTLELTWTSGPPIEVFVTQASEFEGFRATFARGEGDVRHYGELASTPGPASPTFSGQVNLAPGTYTVVLEHTPNGALKPPKGDGDDDDGDDDDDDDNDGDDDDDGGGSGGSGSGGGSTLGRSATETDGGSTGRFSLALQRGIRT